MVEYRPVPDEEREAFRRVLDYAFRPEAGPAPDREGDDESPQLGDRRGLYDGEELVTTAVHHEFEVAIRGRWIDVAGLSAVATRPERRHRGLVRRLLGESLAEYRERGLPFALLWPFKHPFYRQFGWGRLGEFGRSELEPDALATVADHPLAGGEFAPLATDDVDELRALDDRFAERYDLTMRRTPDWYRHRFFAGWGDDPYVYGWYRDGELRGYLRYRIEEAGDDRRLDVVEFGAPDPEAAVNLLRYLHFHADQVDAVRVFGPPDDLVFDLVDDPGEVDREYVPGAMGRLVDVVAGLEALPAPDGVAGSATLSVDDPLVDGNDGEFALAAADGSVAVEPGVADGPRAGMPVETLSRLAFGTTTVERAAVAGGLEADEAAAALLADLFPPRDGYLREFF